MGDLYLNALPLSVTSDPDMVIGRVWPRDDDIDAHLREHPARSRDFYHRSFRTETFVWPAPGGTLPEEHRARGEDITLPELPAAVLASAAREAAVRQLISKGFELRSSRIGQPARLSRRKLNLATKAVKNLRRASVSTPRSRCRECRS